MDSICNSLGAEDIRLAHGLPGVVRSRIEHAELPGIRPVGPVLLFCTSGALKVALGCTWIACENVSYFFSTSWMSNLH